MSKEKLEELKEKVEELQDELRELTDEELDQILGGAGESIDRITSITAAHLS
ncbi:MAG: type A2 lanthipeptide [Prevotellaceae bacterium]|nr:type A2 lanthipeptide [Prevotellaceae bacterium]